MTDTTAIRAEIARAEGWEIDQDTGEWFRAAPTARLMLGCHPIPDTLDEAAKLPEGWTWHRCFDDDHNTVWQAFRGRPCAMLEVADTGDEKSARFALRLAVLKHTKDKPC